MKYYWIASTIEIKAASHKEYIVKKYVKKKEREQHLPGY